MYPRAAQSHQAGHKFETPVLRCLNIGLCFQEIDDLTSTNGKLKTKQIITFFLRGVIIGTFQDLDFFPCEVSWSLRKSY